MLNRIYFLNGQHAYIVTSTESHVCCAVRQNENRENAPAIYIDTVQSGTLIIAKNKSIEAVVSI